MKKRLVCLAVAGSAMLFAKDAAVERIAESAKVFNEVMAAPDKGIPRDLLEKAKCIVIIPGVKKAGFVVGGQYGKGVETCRQSGARGWTAPSTVRVEGGSIGAQIGGGETDLVMVVMNDKGAERLMKDSFTVGGEGAVMAGPVGRDASANTDAMMTAEILSYSRSRGAFAGVTLNGSTLRVDNDDNTKIYGHPVNHQDILNGKVSAPASANVLYSALNGNSDSTRSRMDSDSSKKHKEHKDK